MNKQEVEALIEGLQAKLTNLKIGIAVPMGVLMLLYFFTYAQLIDRGMMGALYFELITSILFVLALIYLNPLAFRLIKWRYSGRQEYRRLFKLIDAQSINKPAEQLSEKVMSGLET